MSRMGHFAGVTRYGNGGMEGGKAMGAQQIHETVECRLCGWKVWVMDENKEAVVEHEDRHIERIKNRKRVWETGKGRLWRKVKHR